MFAAFKRWRSRRKLPAPRAFRYESFGGIAQLGGRFGWPQALVFVDRDRARALGHDSPPSGLWDGEQPTPDSTAPLSAPLEAHLQLTNRCDAGCATCYTGASPQGTRGEWGLPEWCAAIDELAAAGVFHVALGGGESATLPWLGELLSHCWQRGIIPNLTTSGLYDQATLDRVCDLARRGLFGQVNLSIDGVGEIYTQVRGFAGFAKADHALRSLLRVFPDVGINSVLTRVGFDRLDELFAYARRAGVSEIELLRLKPAGRGASRDTYQTLRCSDDQHRTLLPRILELSRRHRLPTRLDCSLVPFVAYQQLDQKLLHFLSIYGCAGGDLLTAARADGKLSACSFAAPTSERVTNLRQYFATPTAFAPFRDYPAAAEPCQSCAYLRLCRGGCRVVASHVTGSLRAPDPECPRVIDFRASQANQGDDALPSAGRRLKVLA